MTQVEGCTREFDVFILDQLDSQQVAEGVVFLPHGEGAYGRRDSEYCAQRRKIGRGESVPAFGILVSWANSSLERGRTVLVGVAREFGWDYLDFPKRSKSSSRGAFIGASYFSNARLF